MIATMTPSLETLWSKYHRRRTTARRNAIVERYLDVAQRCAGLMAARLPAWIDRDELISLGYLGLIDAVEAFAPAGGARFRPFARWRVRWAILDGLQDADHLRRWTRANLRTCGVRPPELISLDAPLSATTSPATLADVLPDHKAADPYDHLQRQELREGIRGIVDSLEHRHRVTVLLRYEAELTYREIGRILGVGCERARQILQRAHRVIRRRAIMRDRLRAADMARTPSERKRRRDSRFTRTRPASGDGRRGTHRTARLSPAAARPSIHSATPSGPRRRSSARWGGPFWLRRCASDSTWRTWRTRWSSSSRKVTHARRATSRIRIRIMSRIGETMIAHTALLRGMRLYRIGPTLRRRVARRRAKGGRVRSRKEWIDGIRPAAIGADEVVVSRSTGSIFAGVDAWEALVKATAPPPPPRKDR